MEYALLKLIHLAAVVIFLGNVITGLFWMHIAVKTRDLHIIAFTMKGIIKADRWFTIPGVVIITTAGIFAAIYGNLPLIRTGWIFCSFVMFTISGLAFAFKVAPLQKKLLSLATDGPPASFDWAKFNSAYRAWDIWGLVATLTPLAAFAMMIFKLPA